MTGHVDIHHADAVQWAREYRGPLFHAMLCDPPYHLTNRTPDVKACADCGRVLGGADGKPDACPRCGGHLIYQRSQGGRGFMSKEWDGGDLAFNPDTWAAFAEVLHPGAFIMAFCSSRGWHRMACAIEDAGFVFHPSVFLFGYSYGSGFPKSTRVRNGVDYPAFTGHRYGLQALKPALEPIIVAQKPYAGKPVDCITRTGAGALNVDGGRIPTDELTPRNNGTGPGANGWANQSGGYVEPSPLGRWPANLLLDDAGAAAIDAQSGPVGGHRTGPNGVSAKKYSHNNSIYSKGISNNKVPFDYGDTGGASRFFYRIAEQLDDADPVRYVAKASRRERDAGLEGMPERENPSEWGMPAQEGNPKKPRQCTGLDKVRNPHPTIKPLTLTRYLATLLLPPAEYAPRRLFIPFAGAGSECVGAMQAGWDEVVGVEMMNDAEHNYVDIARARVAYWASKEPML